MYTLAPASGRRPAAMRRGPAATGRPAVAAGRTAAAGGGGDQHPGGCQPRSGLGGRGHNHPASKPLAVCRIVHVSGERCQPRSVAATRQWALACCLRAGSAGSAYVSTCARAPLCCRPPWRPPRAGAQKTAWERRRRAMGCCPARSRRDPAAAMTSETLQHGMRACCHCAAAAIEAAAWRVPAPHGTQQPRMARMSPAWCVYESRIAHTSLAWPA
eukprot:363794-Chlamydomonas_euryale.AAC.2